MANQPLQSPANPHFFQPILPGYDAHLTIPVAFYSKHIEGKNKPKTAKLRSDASDKTWEVKIDGRRFTEGWKDFVTAHDLRIGDIIVYKHEGDMVFHVTPFGRDFCEIQYVQSLNIDEDDRNNQHKIRNVLRKKNIKVEREQVSSLSYDYCFVAKVTASNLQVDTLHLPTEATSSYALNRTCHKMIVVNEEGNSWTLNLRFKESDKRYYIGGGWRRFCHENKLKVGDCIPFNLVGDGKTTPMICMYSKEECSELSKKTKMGPKWLVSSSSSQNRFVTITLTRYNIQNSKLISKDLGRNLPLPFTKISGIKKQKKIILMDKNGVKLLTNLLNDNGRIGLGKGWKVFFEANDVLKIGESFMLELIWENKTPVLKFCSKDKIEPRRGKSVSCLYRTE